MKFQLKTRRECLTKGGYTNLKARFDERGNQTETAYFGVDGKPFLCNDGYASVAAKYDERGNVLETAYFGVDGDRLLFHCKR